MLASSLGAHQDPDILLVETMLAPPPLADARRSLEYWQGRRKALPVYRCRARREAREMAARWEARVRAAERVRFEASVVGRILSAIGLSRLILLPLPLTKRRLIVFAWALVPPKIKLVAGGLVAAWLIVALAVVATAAAIFAELA
jgi:hypothetical protein